MFLGRPKAIYANPCEQGTPLTDDLSGAPVACALRTEDGTVCPSSYECTAVAGSTQAVCCPKTEELEAEASEDYGNAEMRPQTSNLHCVYLILSTKNIFLQCVNTYKISERVWKEPERV